MRRLLLGLALLVVGGCGPTNNKPIHTIGYVRSIWVDRCIWTVVIEGEDKVVFSVRGYSCQVPPVWQGLHGEFQYESDSDLVGYYKNFQTVRRLD